MKRMSSPRITVLMSIYKDKDYLEEAVKSILNQSYRNFEFLIVAEPETPQETINLIRKFRDKRIRLIINKKHLGFANSLNRGIRLARGKYIARMDADDVSHKNRLLIQLMYMKLHPKIAVCGAGVRKMDAKGKVFEITHMPMRHEIIKMLLHFNDVIFHPTVMINTGVLPKDRYIYWNHVAEDYELWTRICSHYKMHNMYFCLVDRRYHGKNMVFTKKDMVLKIDTRIQKSLWEREGIEFLLEYPFYVSDGINSKERRNRLIMINGLETITENFRGKKKAFQTLRNQYL